MLWKGDNACDAKCEAERDGWEKYIKYYLKYNT
jgi:hypothetical protein